jgi:hypothetical protein
MTVVLILIAAAAVLLVAGFMTSNVAPVLVSALLLPVIAIAAITVGIRQARQSR